MVLGVNFYTGYICHHSFSMTFKQKVYQHFLAQLQSKIDALQHKMDDLAESLKNETKSTAGDKHETARAFVHIEQAQTGAQLNELLEQKSILTALDIYIVADKAIKGSLVKTDKAHFFISIAQGKAVIDGHVVFALSHLAPLGQKLMGASEEQNVEMNGTRYTILEVK